MAFTLLLVTQGSYDRLQAAAVARTVERLQSRIVARFPERSLGKVAGELHALVGQVGQEAQRTHRRLRVARLASRIGVALIVLVAGVALALAVTDLVEHRPTRATEWTPFLESAINDLVFAGIGVFFLRALPDRVERRVILDELHRLRSLAHVIDMHQLTKDPERLRSDFRPTSASVPQTMTPSEMVHYLDYCSELLSLVAKTAALCAEHHSDDVVLDTVSDIENLTTGMSRKIWQKIGLLPIDVPRRPQEA